MLDVNEFIEIYYEDYDADYELMSLEEFQEFKKNNGIEEWDYPLEEYEHLAENGIKAVPVRFADYYGGYDYRFCEVTEEMEVDVYLLEDEDEE